MRDVRVYWKEVRAREQSLPDFVWLTSVAGGRVVETRAFQAAQLLHAKSHRVATAEEVAALRAEEESWNRRAAEERLRKAGVAVVAVGKKAG